MHLTELGITTDSNYVHEEKAYSLIDVIGSLFAFDTNLYVKSSICSKSYSEGNLRYIGGCLNVKINAIYQYCLLIKSFYKHYD